ncbi:MAG: hypothetical protein MI867_27770 [Pseudomonadales bacterium]|nr:hypothetical protein [Pseudomonadales bacterium]
MGHVILVFGTLVAINLGLGYVVSDYLYEDEQQQGVVEIQEVSPEAAASTEPAVEAPKAE